MAKFALLTQVTSADLITPIPKSSSRKTHVPRGKFGPPPPLVNIWFTEVNAVLTRRREDERGTEMKTSTSTGQIKQ